MQMSGVTNIYEFTGIQSVTNFTPPLTLSTTVNGLVAAGCPFAIFLVNSNLSQWLSLQGNVSSINSGYYGMWVNYTGSGKGLGNRGVSLYASPNTNVWYTLQFSIGSDGNGSVTVSDTNGVEGVLSGLAAGLGPYYVVLAQKEGYPAVPGPNVALWQSVRIVTGPNVAAGPAAAVAEPGPGSGMEHQRDGPGAAGPLRELPGGGRIESF